MNDRHLQTAPTVRWIFAQRLAGRSVSAIAATLNVNRVPNPSLADRLATVIGPATDGDLRTDDQVVSLPMTRASPARSWTGSTVCSACPRDPRGGAAGRDLERVCALIGYLVCLILLS